MSMCIRREYIIIINHYASKLSSHDNNWFKIQTKRTFVINSFEEELYNVGITKNASGTSE